MIALALTLALVTPAPVATDTMSSAPAGTASAAPATTIPASAMTPSSAETPAPRASESPSDDSDGVTYAYRFVPFPPKNPAAPRIFAVYLNNRVLHAPGPIDIRIDTSPGVVRVEEHTGKKSYAIPMTAPGRFVSNGRLPKVPFVAHGVSVNLNFTAVDAAGVATSVTVPFQIK